MVEQTTDDRDLEWFDSQLDELHERLKDEYNRFDIRAPEFTPRKNLRAVVYLHPPKDDGDKFDSAVRTGHAKVTVINALPDTLEVESVSEGYEHMEVRPAHFGECPNGCATLERSRDRGATSECPECGYVR